MNYYNVGKIVNTQGLQGEMRVLSVTDFAEERFKKGSKLAVFDDKDNFLIDVEIASHRKQKNFDIIKFKGMYHINDIEKYKGKSLFVTRENAVELEEDEYYIGDLIGMEVYTDDSEERFGVLKDVMETGANEVYIITSENHGEVLLPAIHECILDIDVEAKKMKVHLMEGLL